MCHARRQQHHAVMLREDGDGQKQVSMLRDGARVYLRLPAGLPVLCKLYCTSAIYAVAGESDGDNVACCVRLRPLAASSGRQNVAVKGITPAVLLSQLHSILFGGVLFR